MFKFTANPSNIDNLTPTLKRWIKAEISEDNYLVMVTAQKYKSKRSTQANARYWSFVTGLADHIGISKDEMHDILKFKFLSDDLEVGGEMVRKLKSTPKTDTKEFAEYCEKSEAWASSLGYYFE